MNWFAAVKLFIWHERLWYAGASSHGELGVDMPNPTFAHLRLVQIRWVECSEWGSVRRESCHFPTLIPMWSSVDLLNLPTVSPPDTAPLLDRRDCLPHPSPTGSHLLSSPRLDLATSPAMCYILHSPSSVFFFFFFFFTFIFCTVVMLCVTQ